MYELKTLTGKAAVFVRAFIEALEDGVPLRYCQDAGLKAVEAENSTISVPYISKLSRQMSDDGLFEKARVKKGYNVSTTDKTEKFIAWLDDNPDYGSTVKREIAPDDLVERSKMIDYLAENHAVQISAEQKVSKSAFRLLMERFNNGELSIAFVPTGSGVGFKTPDGEHKGRARLYADS